MKTCTIISCDKPLLARGWCTMHYARWQRHGDPLWQPPSFEERLWIGINANHPSGCWWWKDTPASEYGKIQETVDGRRITRLVHREVYQRLVGPIPEGLELDHLCRNRPCCKPSHLEPAKDKCDKGHPFNDENTYFRPDRPGHRICKQCNREAALKHYHKTKNKTQASVDAAKAKRAAG